MRGDRIIVDRIIVYRNIIFCIPISSHSPTDTDTGPISPLALNPLSESLPLPPINPPLLNLPRPRQNLVSASSDLYRAKGKTRFMSRSVKLPTCIKNKNISEDEPERGRRGREC